MANTSEERCEGTGSRPPAVLPAVPSGTVIDLAARLDPAAPDTAAEPSGHGTRVLMMLRFTSGPCPPATELSRLSGVRRVHTLCALWNYMLEFTEDVPAAVTVGVPHRQVVTVLGRPAEIEILRVSEDLSCRGAAVAARTAWV